MDTGERHGKNEIRRCGESVRSASPIVLVLLLAAVDFCQHTRFEQGFSGTKIKKSDIGWAKAGSAQLGFRGTIGMCVVVVTARVFLRVPCRLVLDSQCC